MSNTTLLLPLPNKSEDVYVVVMSSGVCQSAYSKFESHILNELLLLALATTYSSIVFFLISLTLILLYCKVSSKSSQKVKILGF